MSGSDKALRLRVLAWRLHGEYARDRINDMAASLVFFGVLALFPFLIFAVAVAGLVMDPQRTQSLIESIGRVAPPDVQRILSERITALAAGNNGTLLSLGMAGAIWASSSGLFALTRALNVVHGVEETRPFWKVRLISLGMTLAAGLISLLAVSAAFFGPVLAKAVGGPVGESIRVARLPAAGLLMMLLWALLYWALPNVDQKFKVITPGTIAGVVVWLVASWGFSVYARNFGKYDAVYGSLAGVVVLLLWMWISAQVLLMGAEINALLEPAPAEGTRPTDEAVAAGRAEAQGVPARSGARGRRASGAVGFAAGALSAWILRRRFT